MKKRIGVLFVIAMAITLLMGLAVPAWAVDVSGPYYDASGCVETRIYHALVSGRQNTAVVNVAPDEVCVGGGAWVDYGNGPGAFLTGSYPLCSFDYLIGWVAQSKDLVRENVHNLHVYAVGMKLKNSTTQEYLSRETVQQYIKCFSNNYNYVASKTYSTVVLPANYKMISGGAQVIDPFTRPGNFLTNSFHFGTRGWQAEAKDHLVASPGTVTAWGIAVKNDEPIPGFGYLKTLYYMVGTTTSPGVPGILTHNVPVSGYCVVGAGAINQYSGSGRMLTALMISNNGVEIRDKDYDLPDSGNLYSQLFVIQRDPTR